VSKNKEKVLIKKNYYFILNIIIAIVPVIYDTFLPIFGQAWGLQVEDETGSIIATSLGVFVKILLNLIVIGAILWYNIAAEHRGETIKKSDLDKLIEEKEGLWGLNQLFSKLLRSTFKICSSKYDTLLALIKEIQSKGLQPIEVISNPDKQLKAIIEKMISCVANVTSIDESCLRTRVAYRFQNGDWKWLTGYESNGYFNIPNLQSAKKSTFNCVTRTDEYRENFIFFNKKSVAVKKQKYVYEPFRDIEGETYNEGDAITEGSILAKSLYVGDASSTAFAEMAIFIDTTDDGLLLKDDSRESLRRARRLLKNEVFSNFEERIKIELALLYLSSLSNK
jgi:hypothetical protein